MAEAQAYCTAVLRLISLAEEQRGALVAAGLVRYLLPLLEAKTSPARWNTRQVRLRAHMHACTHFHVRWKTRQVCLHVCVHACMHLHACMHFHVRAQA